MLFTVPAVLPVCREYGKRKNLTVKKSLKLVLKALIVFVPLGYFLPKVTLFYVICGFLDVVRNRGLDFSIVTQYFLGNGTLTWVLSPFNILMDILALPNWNKGIYRLEDLPRPYQEEVNRLIEAAYRENLVEQLEERTRDQARTMMFFKWYGANVDTFINIPAYHEKYRYIQTIGVSVFNKKESTSRHFGPLRATLRVLYNLNTMADNNAFITVGTTTNYWRENKLFIFDDTLLHQSFNKTDSSRYCLFVDILRPSPFPFIFALIVRILRVFLRGVNFVFYKNWKVIK